MACVYRELCEKSLVFASFETNKKKRHGDALDTSLPVQRRQSTCVPGQVSSLTRLTFAGGFGGAGRIGW